MFRQIVNTSDQNSDDLLYNEAPSILLDLMERWYQNSLGGNGNNAGLLEIRTINLPGTRPPIPQGTRPPKVQQGSINRKIYHHLIYAYLIENTRVYEIFWKVIYEFLHGEKLGVPDDNSRRWLRNTEELFYKDPPPFLSISVVSHLRPDIRASRRNAYYRMFGMDLNHGTNDGKPYPYVKPEASNKNFVSTLEDFLREVWVGLVYNGSSSGKNETDKAAIARSANKLRDMLVTRRQGGNLTREEFFYVATMSWLHLTLDCLNHTDSNSAIVKLLNATAASAEQRLFKIAERVGLPAHGKSENFFAIAEPLSLILRLIEESPRFTSTTAEVFFEGDIGNTMRDIITHWSLLTGHNMKERKISK